MAPKSMSSEVENIELKGKENNTDKLNLSGQTARQPFISSISFSNANCLF